MLSACSQQPQAAGAAAASGHGDWVNQGSSACEKVLTAQIVADILEHPAGKAKSLSAQSCVYESDVSGGRISIILSGGGPQAFDAHQQFLVDAVPLPGVGDKASRSMIGIEAVKGNDRNCAVHAGGAPGSTKLTGEALAKKLGEICNNLFGMP